jgi:oxygen-independent coproporphyrinogen-3 oxidase
MLKVEDGTPYSLDSSILSHLPDDDLVCDMYLKSVEMFESYGYMQYEVSNFAKLGFESRHNLKYWQCVDYLGIGASSHSCFEGKRFLVPNDRDKFILDEHQTTVLTESTPYTFEEVGMLALRLTSGLDTKLYPQYAEKVLKRAKPLETCGYLTIRDGVVSLTPRGFLVSNSIIEELVL